MLRVYTHITIGSLSFPFVTDYSIETNIKNQTQGGTITIPKNLFYRDASGRLRPFSGQAVKVSDLIKRGDKVKIEAGYYGYAPISTIFEGFVSMVGSKTPIEISVEDNMYILKQTPVTPKTFTTLEALLSNILQGTGFTFQTMAEVTNIGQFSTGNETAAQVLSRLEKDYKFNAYFRGSELRCGVIRFPRENAKEYIFNFQKNIIDDTLEYKYKDDVKLSCIASNTIEEGASGTTQDGKPKTKRKTLRALVEFVTNGKYETEDGTKYNITDVSSGYVPTATEGERYDYFFLGATTIEELGKMGAEQLQRVYYTGYRGDFTTFGVPHTVIGDIANLQDSVLPERNGRYQVVAVKYAGGTSGLRQTIEIEMKLGGQ